MKIQHDLDWRYHKHGRSQRGRGGPLSLAPLRSTKKIIFHLNFFFNVLQNSCLCTIAPLWTLRIIFWVQLKIRSSTEFYRISFGTFINTPQWILQGVCQKLERNALGIIYFNFLLFLVKKFSMRTPSTVLFEFLSEIPIRFLNVHWTRNFIENISNHCLRQRLPKILLQEFFL